MILKNKDINLLIKMENLIGINEKRLFGRNKDKKCIVNWYDGTQTIITIEDFADFMELIERALQDKKNASKKLHNITKITKKGTEHTTENGQEKKQIKRR